MHRQKPLNRSKYFEYISNLIIYIYILPLSREIPVMNQTMKQMTWFTGIMSQPGDRGSARMGCLTVSLNRLLLTDSQKIQTVLFLKSSTIGPFQYTRDHIVAVYRIQFFSVNVIRMKNVLLNNQIYILISLEVLVEALDCVFELFPGRLASVATVL